MTSRAIIGIISFCIAMAGCFVGNMAFFAMMEDVNRIRPGGKMPVPFGFTNLIFFDVLTEYRSYYPEGRLRLRLRSAFVVMAVGMISTAVCLFIRFR